MPPRAFVLHILRIVVAWLAASLAAGIALAYLFTGFEPQGFATTIEYHAGVVSAGALILGPLVAFYAALPALGFIALAEYLAITAGIYYAGLAALASALMAYLFLPGLAYLDIAHYGIAGVIAGFVYWAIAGRRAGLRRAGRA